MKRIIAVSLSWLMLVGSLAPAEALITLEEEREIAREALDEIIIQAPLVEDPEIVDYVRGLGANLVSHLTDNPFNYKFWVIDESIMNAFALPAGYIFIFRGMITALDNEAELVGIMAHEISHVSHRHLANRMEKSQPLTIASIAGIVAGLVLGALGAGPLGPALTMGSIGAGAQAQLAFSREDEEQADFSGFRLMTASGYPGTAMAQSFQILTRQEQLMGGANVPVYLLSHPTSAVRMERMENLAQRYPQSLPPQDNHKFLRMKTKLIALYEKAENSLDYFQRRLRQRPNNPDMLDLYGLALVETRNNRYGEVLRLLDILDAAWPKDAGLLKMRALCHLRQGNFNKAQTIYHDLLLTNHDDVEILSNLSETYLQLNQPAAARQTLELLLEKDPENPQTQYDLGMAMGRLGREAEASAYLGLSFKNRNNIKSAQFHLTKAVQDLPSDSALRRQCADALYELENRELAEEEKRRMEEQQQEEEERRRREEDARTQTKRPPRPWEIMRLR